MDFWTTVAQVLNFLLFVAVLYYLLYRPVGRLMKERRDKMEAERRDAEQKLAEAERLRADAQQAARDLEAERDRTLREAREQAEARRKELLDQAQKEGRERLERFRRVMEQERSELLDRVRGELRDTVVAVAAAALRDAAGPLLDRSVERVETLVAELPEEQVEAARKELAANGNRVPVRAATAPTDEQIARLRKALAERLGVEAVELDVQEDASLLAGLEVLLGHARLSAHWRDVVDEAMKQGKQD